MRRPLSLLVLLLAFTLPSAASGPRSQSITTGESDAEGIVILHAFYPGYWWDHTDLTVADGRARDAPEDHPIRGAGRS